MRGDIAPAPFGGGMAPDVQCIGAPLLVSRHLNAGSFDHPPPRGSQSITLMLSGRFRAGQRAVRNALEVGDLRWSSWQSKETHVAESIDGGPIRIVRLWMTVDERPHRPRSAHCVDVPRDQVPQLHRDGSAVRVLCGSAFGLHACAPFDSPGVTFLEVELEPGAVFQHPTSSTDRVIVHISSGSMTLPRVAGETFCMSREQLGATQLGNGQISFEAGAEGTHALVAVLRSTR
jgi:redox-sensitive bicupin YhaK (pirin superfamily)